MVPSATALALCLALLLACPTHGEELPSPRAVRFAARTGWHLLRWEPGHGCPSDARYEVEYIVYGAGTPWTAVPGCRNTSEHSCDLTPYTPDPERRYHARVRAVAGNHTSSWQKTHGFFPQQAGVHLVGQSLSVMGNSIQVRLLLHAGNTSLEHSDFQKEMTRYHVYIRRTRDNHTVTMVKNSTEFTLRELVTSSRAGSAELLPDILSSSFIILSLLGLLGALLACTCRGVHVPCGATGAALGYPGLELLLRALSVMELPRLVCPLSPGDTAASLQRGWAPVLARWSNCRATGGCLARLWERAGSLLAGVSWHSDGTAP